MVVSMKKSNILVKKLNNIFFKKRKSKETKGSVNRYCTEILRAMKILCMIKNNGANMSLSFVQTHRLYNMLYNGSA